MSDDQVRIEIGFAGGGLLSALVPASAADRLAKALSDGTGGVAELVSSDGDVIVTLDRVAYLKRFAREGRVGFGGA
jgi:hypothetical protein